MRKTIPTTAATLASALLLLAACGGAAQNSTNTNTAASNRAVANNTLPNLTTAGPANLPPKISADGHDHGPTEGARRISIEEARAEAEAGRAVFVDVRGPDAYREGRIKGALLVPENEVTARASQLPKDKLIITYCA